MDPRSLRIDSKADEPIYRQIAAQMRRLVANGSLGVDAALPSVRSVASHHRINPMTVSQAYQCLVREGIARRDRGGPLRVAKAPSSVEVRSAMLDAQLQQVLHAAQDLGLGAGDVIERLWHLSKPAETSWQRDDDSHGTSTHGLD